MATKLDQYKDHIGRLITASGVSYFEYLSPKHAVMVWRGPQILTPPLKSYRSYWLFLHEMGHFNTVSKYSDVTSFRDKRYYEWEIAAWQWALDNTETPPTKHVWKLIRACLGTYYHWATMADCDMEQHIYFKFLQEVEEHI